MRAQPESKAELKQRKVQETIAQSESKLVAAALTPPEDPRVSIMPGTPEVIQLKLKEGESVEVQPGAMCYM